MQMSNLKPASSLAQRYGAKCIAYGGPGSGKTPLTKTAPRPVLCAVEPGMLSMRDAHNVPAWEAYDVKRLNEFFDWVFQSSEAKNFDTVCIDSISQMAEIYLADALKKNSHGMKAYGVMAETVMDRLNKLYYMPQKHMYLIAKQTTVEEGGVMTRKPYFPGQVLPVQVPHMFDEILHIGLALIPSVSNVPVPAIRCHKSIDIVARDRSGNLAEYEPMDLTALFAKVMAN